MKNINMLTIAKIVSVAVLSMAFAMPMLMPFQAEAWHIGGSWSNLFVQGGTPNILSGSNITYTNNTVTEPAISGYCSANAGTINVGNSATWTVYPSGGNGTYTYNWSGSDSLSGSSASVTKVYGLTGSKTASVKVTSHGVVKDITCSTNISVVDNNNNNNNYSTLSATCQPNTTSTNVGNTVTWSASVNGGNGTYYYNWNGTDGLYGSDSYISRAYSYAGTKTAYLTITSNNQSITVYCNNSVYVSDYNNNYNYGNTQYIGSNGMQFIGTGGFIGYNGYTDNYNYNYNSALNVSCSANIGSGVSGNTVTWSAIVSGGNGAYTYSWTGTDNLTGYSQAVNKTYWYAGSKVANVTVTANGQSITRTCGNTVAISTLPINVTNTANNSLPGDYPPTVTTKPAAKTPELAVACSANTAKINPNETAVWISNVTGGNGKYTYDWQGSDGLSGDANFVAKTYVTTGQKTAVLTVKSGTQLATIICGNVAVGDTTNNMAASAFFAGWTGPFIVILLIAIIAFLGIILYFLNLRDRKRPVVTPTPTNDNPQQ